MGMRYVMVLCCMNIFLITRHRHTDCLSSGPGLGSGGWLVRAGAARHRRHQISMGNYLTA